jgi:DNA-binding response OmpR family regulator
MTADEGRIGLAFCRAARVDLLITDLVMPGMEGMETIRRFRNEFTGVPIIAISGNPNVGNVLDTAVRLGAVRTLAKPFLPQELLEVVKAVLTAPAATGAAETFEILKPAPRARMG